MGIPDQQRVRLRRAALLHDICKLSVPNRILDKPGKLDAEEWEVVKQHPYFTYEILARVPVFSEFAYDASCHHERIDGRGYYRGVNGESLSAHARIMATADIFDALSAARPYRGPMPLEQVLKIIQEGRGTQLCPDTVDAVMAVAHRNSAALMSA
jgi:HD-GYP domain-containing protein (c-di-GMP phosphodiesterase class II)